MQKAENLAENRPAFVEAAPILVKISTAFAQKTPSLVKFPSSFAQKVPALTLFGQTFVHGWANVRVKIVVLVKSSHQYLKIFICHVTAKIKKHGQYTVRVTQKTVIGFSQRAVWRNGGSNSAESDVRT